MAAQADFDEDPVMAADRARVILGAQALRDPRFRRLAKQLGCSHFEALARCLHVWLLCYERRQAIMAVEDVNIAADHEQFAQAMCAADLAEIANPTDVYVRGVSERISFLERQAKKGAISGRSRREMLAERQKRTSVQQTFAERLNLGITREDLDLTSSVGSGSSGSRLTKDSTEHEPPGRSPRPSPGARSEGEGLSRPVEVPIVAPSESQAPQKRSVPTIPDPPEDAIRLAGLLLDLVVANNPGTRVAYTAGQKRDAMTVRWAWVLEKLHRIDKQSWGMIQGMIEWSAKHNWWCRVILGADALREHWDKMLAQRTRQTLERGRAGDPTRRGPTAQALEEVEALERAAAEDAATRSVPTDL